MRLRLLSSVAGLCAALAPAPVPAGAVEVKLLVEEPAKVERKAGTVTSGVPFAKGTVKDVSKLSVRAGDKAVPAQFLKLAPWDDGSVRWALLDCQVDVPAGGKTGLAVSGAAGNPAPRTPVKVEDGADAVKVSAGPLEFAVSKKRFNLFASLKVDGKELIGPSGRGLVIYKEGGGQVAAGSAAEVTVEQAGPMRAIVCAKGRFPGVHNDLLGYTVRITAFAGRRFVKVQVWLENGGAYGYADKKDKNKPKPEWFAFEGMAVELGLGLGDGIEATCEGVKAPGKFKVAQRCRPPFKWKDFEYRITGAEGAKELKKGERTDGVVALKGEKGRLTVAVRHFWQNYEKAIELDGAALKLWLWPTDGEYPRDTGKRKFNYDHAAMMKRFRKPGLYQLAGGVHKGHELILDFSGRDPEETAAELSAPLAARATPLYCASTEAAPGWFAPADFKAGDAELDFKFRGWNRMALNAIDLAGKTSIYRARRGAGGSFWYGWMDFGDICQISAAFYAPKDCGFCPSSLHYDWPWTMLVNYLRMGRRGFLDLGTEMARHRIDVDQCWSDRDLPRYRRLARLDRGLRELHFGPLYWTPAAEKNWLGGVVLYYMLTGEPKARECCMRNYAGIKEAWVEPRKKDKNSWASTLGSTWSILNLCALYDLTAEKKYLDDALGLFKGHIARQRKDRGTFLLEGGGRGTKVGRAYCYSTQALCALHHRTGDKDLMKLLVESCEKEFPEGFYDASLYLSNLYAYVGYKKKNEDYLEKALDSFIEGFPESGNPPCFTPGSPEWTWKSPMTLRTGHILQYVKWKLKGKKK